MEPPLAVAPETIPLYVAGGLLVAIALVASFVGLRRGSITERTNRLMLAGTGVVVVVACVGAVLASRHEKQKHKEEIELAQERGTYERDRAGIPADEAEQRDPLAPESNAQRIERDGARPQPTGDSTGKQLFVRQCGQCHTMAAAGTTGEVGPSIDGLYPDPTANRVLQAIRIGGQGSGRMPKNLVVGAQADAVARYVAENAAR